MLGYLESPAKHQSVATRNQDQNESAWRAHPAPGAPILSHLDRCYKARLCLPCKNYRGMPTSTKRRKIAPIILTIPDPLPVLRRPKPPSAPCQCISAPPPLGFLDQEVFVVANAAQLVQTQGMKQYARFLTQRQSWSTRALHRAPPIPAGVILPAVRAHPAGLKQIWPLFSSHLIRGAVRPFRRCRDCRASIWTSPDLARLQI